MPSGSRTTSPTRPRGASGSTTWWSPSSVSAASARRHGKRLGRPSAVLAHHNQHGDPPHEGQECHRHADPRVLDEPDVYAPGLGALGHDEIRHRADEEQVPREGGDHGETRHIKSGLGMVGTVWRHRMTAGTFEIRFDRVAITPLTTTATLQGELPCTTRNA